LVAARAPDEGSDAVNEVECLLAGSAERLNLLAVDLLHALQLLERVLERVPIGERGRGIDAGLLQRVLAVVDRACLREPRDGPGAVLALDLRGLPDARGVGALAADLVGVLAQVLEPSEGGEEGNLSCARLRDVGTRARDRRIADPVEL